jgi:tRNA-specific 2-thiouridylase
LIHFTVGQRRGLAVATGERLYVVRLEPGRNRVIAGPREALGCARAELREVNWLGAAPIPAAGIDLQVRHRAREAAAAARLLPGEDGCALVAFAEPQAGVAPGQACVFYDGTRMLGGGWIERAPLALEPPSIGAPARALAAASGA